MMNMLAIVISLLCAGFVLFQRHFFGLPGQSREKQSKPGTSRSEPPHAKSLVPSSEILVSKSYRSGLERTGADIGTEAFYPVVYCGRIDYSGNCANRKISIGSDGYPNL